MSIEIVARTESDAPVADVWDVLADPGRWPEVDRLLRDVEGGWAPLEAGQQLRLCLVGPVAFTAEVRVVHPLHRLGVSLRPLPGAVADVDVLLLPLPRGRTDVEVRVNLRGPTAPLAYSGARALATVDARLLAAAARTTRV